ncbi:STP3 [Candida pseudojiufengensis]|uniref:STP3 n=1 Tax=Candida pseudojiufengensis TaxID=497109 RepID=UPI0022255057|nr:STP3 [Candida pseudojiufengensis]KAI5967004.1 STP3 [Candida pseudojiufengensis]
MSIFSVGLFKSFSNEDLYTISKSYPLNSSHIYQPFTSKNILHFQFNIHKFLNRLIYGTKRLNELFPKINKSFITNFNNNKNLQNKSSFPINCAADDLDLGFDGSEQIFFNNNELNDLNNLNNHHHNHHHNHDNEFIHNNINFNGYSTNFPNSNFNNKNGFNDDIITPLYQQQYQFELQQQQNQQHQQQNYHQNHHHHHHHHQHQQQHHQTNNQNLPMFDDFFEAHQHHHHHHSKSNKFNENIFESSNNKKPSNSMDVFDIMNKSTISFSPKTSKLNKENLNNNTNYQINYSKFQEFQEFDHHQLSQQQQPPPPYFDDFQHDNDESNNINIPSKSNTTNNKEYELYLQSSIGGTNSSISSADSFLSPLDDEIFGKYSKSSPESFSFENNKLTLHSQSQLQQQHQIQSQSLPVNLHSHQHSKRKNLRKRKLEITSTTSPSSISSNNDLDLPISPTNTMYKQPKQKSKISSTTKTTATTTKTKKMKLSKTKTKKITVKQEPNTSPVELPKEEEEEIDENLKPTITTTRTNNQTVRKLSYTTKTGKIDHTFECPHCDANFKVKGYLTRHLKKHNSSKAFMCPFYQENGKNGTKCHPTGGFSRRDTFKTHLKALHFIYPPGTKSNERILYSGRCAGCFQFFENNFQWLEKHIETGDCQGTVMYKEQINQRLSSTSSSNDNGSLGSNDLGGSSFIDNDIVGLMEDNEDYEEEEIIDDEDDVDEDEDEDVDEI